MNSRVSNCIELHKFWYYSTDLGTNSYSRDQIVYQFFYLYLITICIELIRTTSISVKPYEYHRYLVNTSVKDRQWKLIASFQVKTWPLMLKKISVSGGKVLGENLHDSAPPAPLFPWVTMGNNLLPMVIQGNIANKCYSCITNIEILLLYMRLGSKINWIECLFVSSHSSRPSQVTGGALNREWFRQCNWVLSAG